MHDQPIPTTIPAEPATAPDLTAATAAIRALYAAGWRSDYAYRMADDSTRYGLIHPTGREIAAQVHKDRQVTVSLHGVTLDEAVGAAAGAGLAPATVDTPAEVDPRRAAHDLAAAGVAAGLPIPRSINVGDGLSHGRLELFLRDNDPSSVDRWAAWLALPAPAMTLTPMSSASAAYPTGWFQPYEAQALRHEVTGGWVTVKSYLTVDAPAEAAQGGESK